MNRHFSQSEAWPGFPKRSYAKIDYVEPQNLDEANEIVFAFDAVDCDYREFSKGGRLSVEDTSNKRIDLTSFWAERFIGGN